MHSLLIIFLISLIKDLEDSN